MLRRILPGLLFLASLATAALAQVPPPVPALPDTARITDYSLSNSTCACAVNFQIYGDQTDVDNWIQVQLNGTAVLSTDPTFGWKLTSPSGQLGSIARPITDAILTFNAPQTGTVQITGARRPRRLSQFPENRGVTARDLNVALSDIVAQNRENWDRGGGGGGGGLPAVPPSTVLGNFGSGPQTAGAETVPPCAADGAHALTNSASGGFNCTFVSNGTGTPTTPFIVTNGITSRSAADRFNDRGYNILDFGAKGDGSSHRLSSIYGSLAAAQAVYPFLDDLTQEVDWAATQQAINTSFAGGVPSVYCPGVAVKNGNYLLSNTIQVNQQGNFNNGNPRWSASTTYASGAVIAYNGLAWQSLGNGNKGAAPTAANSYPANLDIAGNDLPFANVTVTSASPAVVTLPNHGFVAGQALIFLKQTYTDVTYPSPALPTGISAGQVYYVLSTGLTTNTFEISATPGGAAVNTSSTGSGVITVSTQVWTLSGGDGLNQGDRSNFIGDPGQSSAEGCRFLYLPVTGPAMVIGPNNGNLIQSVTLTENRNANIYRCQTPNSLTGFSGIAGGGGTHITTYDKDMASGFYIGSETNGQGSIGQLGDSNTWINDHLTSGCYGIHISANQNYVNSAFDSTLDGNNIAASAELGTGLGVYGGNDSASVAQNNAFAVTGVAAQLSSNVFYVQATITSPDSYLAHPLCGYNNQCAYNFANILTTHFGLVPLQIDGFNPATGVINLEVKGDWTAPYHNSLGNSLVTDLLAATTIYLAETVTAYSGSGINVRGTHIENFSNTMAATTLVNSFTRFGNNFATRVENVLIDYNASGGDYVCCKATPSNSILAGFYAQQNMPFVNAQSDTIFENIAFFNIQSQERVLFEGFGNAEFRHSNPSASVNVVLPPQGPGGSWNHRHSGNTFSGPGGAGSGIFDNASPWIAMAGTQADTWRQQGGGGASPTWGVKPAAYASPCVTPAQVTGLASPSLTFVSYLNYISINAPGTGYAVNDTVTLAGGTFSTPAQITVGSVNGSGGITGLKNGFPVGSLSPSTLGSYTVEPASFTQGSTSGVGSGATFNAPIWWVSYTLNVPALWGGTIYHVCNYTGTTQTHYALQSNNSGYSYFTNLTTSNVPNLAWTSSDSSPVIYMNAEALELMYPGLVFSLTPTGGNNGACTSGPPTETFIVTEVHPFLGYVTVIGASSDTGPYLPNWNGGSAATCTGTTIAQAAPNIVNPY